MRRKIVFLLAISSLITILLLGAMLSTASLKAQSDDSGIVTISVDNFQLDIQRIRTIRDLAAPILFWKSCYGITSHPQLNSWVMTFPPV